jgi:hypothetical protein
MFVHRPDAPEFGSNDGVSDGGIVQPNSSSEEQVNELQAKAEQSLDKLYASVGAFNVLVPQFHVSYSSSLNQPPQYLLELDMSSTFVNCRQVVNAATVALSHT